MEKLVDCHAIRVCCDSVAYLLRFCCVSGASLLRLCRVIVALLSRFCTVNFQKRGSRGKNEGIALI